MIKVRNKTGDTDLKIEPLVNRKYLLEKFPGKGGWTFIRIPHISKAQKIKKVKGTIDDFAISKCYLMWKENNVFFPIRATIRKEIKKEVGDSVRVILFPDNDPLKTPQEMLLCLRDEPAALKFYTSLSESERKYYIQWIYSAKKEETKINRLAKAVNRLARGLKLYDREV